jgi:hypothetical protein
VSLLSNASPRCLIWARKTYDYHNNEGPGELLVPNVYGYTTRDQCRTSADILTFLGKMFHDHPAKTEWQILKSSTLDKIHKIRDPGDKQRDRFLDLLVERRC